jgi:hypothetical protein
VIRPARILLIVAVATAAAAVVLPLVAVEGLYRYGLRGIGEPTPAPSDLPLPPLAETAFWLAREERMPPNVEPIYPWRWRHVVIPALYGESLLRGIPGEQMATSLRGAGWQSSDQTSEGRSGSWRPGPRPCG